MMVLSSGMGQQPPPSLTIVVIAVIAIVVTDSKQLEAFQYILDATNAVAIATAAASVL